MAEGSSSLRHVRLITDTALALAPRSVVDLGMGTGKYGFLLREQHDLAKADLGWGESRDWRLRLVGVEAFEQYVTDFQRLIYDEVIVSDARTYLARANGSQPEHFDVALALDVLEHFTPEDGEAFLAAALQRARHVVVLTPRDYYPQEAHENGNELERHLSWWPPSAIEATAKRLGVHATTAANREAVIAVLSNERPMQLAKDQPWYNAAIATRDALIPNMWWSRARHKTGPTVEI
jgi:SAM-dependent methyltransferase